MQTTLEIEASPRQVWRIISDPSNLPRWDRHVIRVQGVPRGGIREGTEYTTELRFMGVRGRVDAKVIELDPERYSKIRLRGLVDATVETRIEAVDSDRSRVHHRVDYTFRGGPLGRFAAMAVRRVGAGLLLRRGAEAQRRQIESAA